MVRMVISIDADDKRWLDREAKQQRTTMTELVRRAIQRMREQGEKPSFEELLDRSAGTWQHGDGLEYQIRIRKEWDREWE